MDLKNFFTSPYNEIYEENMDLLEEYDLVNTFGSPNKMFLKFLKSKNLDITQDEITPELIAEFEDSVDSIKVKTDQIRKQKQEIFTQRKVWINIKKDMGTYLLLGSEGLIIESAKLKIPYSQIISIEIADGGWSRKRLEITTKKGALIFEINEDKAVPLKEIIEDNIAYRKRDEIDDLLELYNLFEEGKISEEELEIRKAIIYSDDVFCTNCGEKIDSDSEFCPNCGHKVSM